MRTIGSLRPVHEPFFNQVLPCSSSSFVLVLESVPAFKDRARGRGTRDEDELAWQVHDTDVRPILEVEALHEPLPGEPTPNPSEEGNIHRGRSLRFPSLEGLGVGRVGQPRAGSWRASTSMFGAHWDHERRSRRRKEADFHARSFPPPYVGGYERGSWRTGLRIGVLVLNALRTEL